MPNLYLKMNKKLRLKNLCEKTLDKNSHEVYNKIVRRNIDMEDAQAKFLVSLNYIMTNWEKPLKTDKQTDKQKDEKED